MSEGRKPLKLHEWVAQMKSKGIDVALAKPKATGGKK